MTDISDLERRQEAGRIAWESCLAELRVEDARAAELRPSNHTAIFEKLAAHSITTVTISFDGYGDSGQVESVAARNGDSVIELPDCTVQQMVPVKGGEVATSDLPLADAVENLAYDLLRQTHAGWENNDGAFGDFVIDVAARTISLDYSERYTAIESYSHQW